MEEAIAKADTLIEALGWIRQFRDKITVIKLGGSVMEDEDALRHVLLDIVFMESVGMRPVVVHGGGKRISRAMDEAGIEPHFIQGRRYTDDATLEIVERVLAYETNEYLTEEIEKLGGRAMTNAGFGWHKQEKPPGSKQMVDAMQPYFEHCIEAFGANRCMLESNFPVDKASCSYTVLWNAYKRLTSGCSQSERSALFLETATGFYEL